MLDAHFVILKSTGKVTLLSALKIGGRTLGTGKAGLIVVNEFIRNTSSTLNFWEMSCSKSIVSGANMLYQILPHQPKTASEVETTLKATQTTKNSLENVPRLRVKKAMIIDIQKMLRTMSMCTFCSRILHVLARTIDAKLLIQSRLPPKD